MVVLLQSHCSRTETGVGLETPPLVFTQRVETTGVNASPCHHGLFSTMWRLLLIISRVTFLNADGRMIWNLDLDLETAASSAFLLLLLSLRIDKSHKKIADRIKDVLVLKIIC